MRLWLLSRTSSGRSTTRHTSWPNEEVRSGFLALLAIAWVVLCVGLFGGAYIHGWNVAQGHTDASVNGTVDITIIATLSIGCSTFLILGLVAIANIPPRRLGLKGVDSAIPPTGSSPRFWKPVIRFFGAFCLCYLTLQIASWIRTTLQRFFEPPTATSDVLEPVWVRIVDAIDAAVSEEILLLATPVALILYLSDSPTIRGALWWLPRSLGITLLFVVLVGVRVPYHLYHGWVPGIAMVVFWMTAFVILYLTFKSIWPFVAAHFFINAVDSVFQGSVPTLIWLAEALVLSAGMCFCVCLIWAYRQS